MSLSAPTARVLPVIGAAALAVLLLSPPSAAATHSPDFEAPFQCDQNWEANTYDSHSPSWFSVDFNRDDDYRAPVRATASGVVTRVTDVGDTSYGKYIIIEHGGGWESLYAHLDAQFVVVGQRVDQGAIIGLLGSSGGSTGPHLHFEQKLNGTVKHAVFHGVSLDYNTTITSHNCADVPIAGDWAGDRRTEVGVFRPRPGGNAFRLRNPNGSVTRIMLGKPGDVPVTGDWNGNGVTDVGVWHRVTQTFLLRTDNGRTREIKMGNIRDVPVAGDWNGDGRTEVGVFSPGKHSFRLRATDGSLTSFRFGAVGSTPVTGDWDGDGRTEVGTYFTAGNSWALRKHDGSVRTSTFGGTGGIPVTGDWNRDGVDTPGTWGPSNALFRLQNKGRAMQVRFGLQRR